MNPDIVHAFPSATAWTMSVSVTQMGRSQTAPAARWSGGAWVG